MYYRISGRQGNQSWPFIDKDNAHRNTQPHGKFFQQKIFQELLLLLGLWVQIQDRGCLLAAPGSPTRCFCFCACKGGSCCIWLSPWFSPVFSDPATLHLFERPYTWT